MTSTKIDRKEVQAMQVNVWYNCNGKYHRFASFYDECNYCYPVDTYTFDEAKEQYIADHAFEGFDYNFICE